MELVERRKGGEKRVDCKKLKRPRLKLGIESLELTLMVENDVKEPCLLKT